MGASLAGTLEAHIRIHATSRQDRDRHRSLRARPQSLRKSSGQTGCDCAAWREQLPRFVSAALHFSSGGRHRHTLPLYDSVADSNPVSHAVVCRPIACARVRSWRSCTPTLRQERSGCFASPGWTACSCGNVGCQCPQLPPLRGPKRTLRPDDLGRQVRSPGADIR